MKASYRLCLASANLGYVYSIFQGRHSLRNTFGSCQSALVLWYHSSLVLDFPWEQPYPSLRLHMRSLSSWPTGKIRFPQASLCSSIARRHDAGQRYHRSTNLSNSERRNNHASGILAQLPHHSFELSAATRNCSNRNISSLQTHRTMPKEQPRPHFVTHRRIH